MQAIVEIKELSVAFQSNDRLLPVLDKVSFNLYPGETLALLGESGCGKSLTSLAIMRLLPMSGVYGQSTQINWLGQDLLNWPAQWVQALRGKKLAMIFQEPMTALNPVMTIGQQIAEALTRDSSCKKTELRKNIISLLQEVEIPEPHKKIDQYPHQLSGGQKQRVVIAMAIASRPDVLIADEPTTALDVTIQAQILTLLKKLQLEYGMSLLFITHDLGVAKAVADRIGVMYAGQVVEQATTREFFSQVHHPYSQQLLAALPSLARRNERLFNISGSVPAMDALPGGCRFHPRCVYAFEACHRDKPQLQAIEKGSVRCHLYPALKQLPPLVKAPLIWEGATHADDILLEVKGLSIEFIHKKRILSRKKEAFKAVSQLSFKVKKGKTLALVGESGCGKTTVCRALLKLIPVAEGNVTFQGQDVLSLKGRGLRQYRKKVQIIFQDPFSSMNPRMNVGEIIAEGMWAQGMNRSFVNKRLLQLLDQVNLPRSSLHRYPHQFSGGQRQRMGIARALATQPELLICDEPTSALDVSVQAQILNLLKELQQETGVSYLFITHNMGVVSYIADDVMVMKNGMMMEFGTCEEIFKQPVSSYTKQLLAAVLDV